MLLEGMRLYGQGCVLALSVQSEHERQAGEGTPLPYSGRVAAALVLSFALAHTEERFPSVGVRILRKAGECKTRADQSAHHVSQPVIKFMRRMRVAKIWLPFVKAGRGQRFPGESHIVADTAVFPKIYSTPVIVGEFPIRCKAQGKRVKFKSRKTAESEVNL